MLYGLKKVDWKSQNWSKTGQILESHYNFIVNHVCRPSKNAPKCLEMHCETFPTLLELLSIIFIILRDRLQVIISLIVNSARSVENNVS